MPKPKRASPTSSSAISPPLTRLANRSLIRSIGSLSRCCSARLRRALLRRSAAAVATTFRRCTPRSGIVSALIYYDSEQILKGEKHALASLARARSTAPHHYFDRSLLAFLNVLLSRRLSLDSPRSLRIQGSLANRRGRCKVPAAPHAHSRFDRVVSLSR